MDRRRKGAQASSLLVILTLMLTSVTAGPVYAGDSHISTPNPMYRSYMYQPDPGDLDYRNLTKHSVWKAEGENVSTRILIKDLDDDGISELVFGTDEGRLVSVEMGTQDIVLDDTPADRPIQFLVVGNVDDDEESELVFTNEYGIYCYDFDKGKLLWNHSYDTLDSEIMLIESRKEDDGLVVNDIIVLRAKGDYYQGPSFFLLRFDGEGKEIFKTALISLGEQVGIRASMLGADLDGDGEVEIFVNDRQASGIGFGGVGRNFWILNSGTGTIVRTRSIAFVRFESGPMLAKLDGRLYVAIGLFQGASPYINDLLLYDAKEDTQRYMDAYDNTDTLAWSHLTFIPSLTSGTIVLASSGWDLHAFRLDDPDDSWSAPAGTTAVLSTNPVACDIDDDGLEEVLVPGGGVTILDSTTGQEEARIEPGVGQRARNIRLTVGDLDDDERSEVVLGYYDDEKTDRYEIFIVGDVDVETDVIELDPIWAWAIVIFVVGANILLVADLYRQRRKRQQEKD
jgi:outer membrane protein assembly factor BamB